MVLLLELHVLPLASLALLLTRTTIDADADTDAASLVGRLFYK